MFATPFFFSFVSLCLLSVSVVRIMFSLSVVNMVLLQQLPKIVIVTSFIIAVTNFVGITSTQLFCITFLFNLVFVLLFFFKGYQREQQLRKELPTFLTLVVLKMKSGSGFKSSYQSALDDMSSGVKDLLLQALPNVTFSQQKQDVKESQYGPLFVDFQQFLFCLDPSSYQVTQQVEGFRRRLLLLEKLRRKSGQASGQAVIQSSLLTLLYGLLFVYSMKKYGFSAYPRLFLFSMGLFLIGLLIMVQLGQISRWKI